METKDTSWIKPGMSVRIGKLSQHLDPNSQLKFSKNSGATGSVTGVDKDYATLYISANITCGKPPQEKVPLEQCEKI
jgi:hypothetical protein